MEDSLYLHMRNILKIPTIILNNVIYLFHGQTFIMHADTHRLFGG